MDQTPKRHIVYETSTGKVLGSFICLDEDVEAKMEINFPGDSEIQIDAPKDLRTFRIDVTKNPVEVIPMELPPLVVSKTTMSADGVDETIISGVPEGLEIQVDGIPYIVNDGSLELSFSVPDTYLLTANQWPWLPWRQEIVAE